MTESMTEKLANKIAEKLMAIAVLLALIGVLYVWLGDRVSKVWSEPLASLSVADLAVFAFAIIAALLLLRRILIALLEGWSR